MEHEHHDIVKAEGKPVEYLKFAGVLAGIVLIATWLAGSGAGVDEWLRWFMGVFLVVFAGFKFIGYRMFVAMFAGYDVVAKRFKAYSYSYPFIELGLGLAYLFDALPEVRDWLVLAIFAIGSIGVAQEIYHRRSGVYCACLGSVIKLPLSTVSLVEDVSMAAMALFMILR